MTLELRSEEDKGLDHISIWGRSTPRRENGKCKGPVAGARNNKKAYVAGVQGAKGRVVEKCPQIGDEGGLWGRCLFPW